MATPSGQPSIPDQPSLLDLARVISSSAAVVDRELSDKDLPPLNDERFPVSFPLLSPEGSRARLELLSAAYTIFRLACGPCESLVNAATRGYELGTIATIIRLRILEYIPPGGARTYHDLAQLTNINEEVLTRIIRYAISTGFLSERAPGRVSHTAASSACARDPNTRDSVLWNINVATPGSIKLYEALQLDPTGRDGTKTGLSVAMGERGEKMGTMWDYHAAHPENEREFNNAMVSTESISVQAPEHVARGFDWGKVESVVDVGGNEGHVCMAICNSYPHIKATVQDIPRVIASSHQKLPTKYANAITFSEYNFFNPQQIVADCYILRFILHDWTDKKARKIIRNLVPALRPGARVLIIEHVVPSETGSAKREIPGYVQRLVHQMDIVMLSLLAGRERTEEHLERLVNGADSRLVLKSSSCPDGSALTVLEFQFTG